MRKEINILEIPLITAGLGNYLSNGIFGQHFIHYPLINQQLEQFAQTHPNCYFVTEHKRIIYSSLS
ncbi:hypothetical protein EG347_02175 [Chryseobacterium sp. G0186]|nr:hypothetical protein EG347_02175 [Chryseobacterium sp. G0186]